MLMVRVVGPDLDDPHHQDLILHKWWNSKHNDLIGKSYQAEFQEHPASEYRPVPIIIVREFEA